MTKLKLEVDRKAISDPFMNITVGCHILKDFYDRYQQIEDPKVRFAKTLTDYNNGENAVAPNLKYAVQVSQKLDQYERILDLSMDPVSFIPSGASESPTVNIASRKE